MITFSGPDCSGKSTQIELLVRHLQDRGRTVRTLWFRPGYSALMDAAKQRLRRLRPGAMPTSAHTEQRERQFARPGVSEAWVALALFDTALHLGAWIRAQLALGRDVICDRYLDDALLDLDLRFERLCPSDWLASRAVERLCPRPDVAVLLQLDEATLNARAAIKNEPFPDSAEVRMARLRAYAGMAQSGRYCCIDASAPIDVVQQAIVAALG